MTTEEREKREHVGIYTVGIDHMTKCPDHPTHPHQERRERKKTRVRAK
jgi:hypothetical protein